jgi:hypothetical protein
VKPLVLPRRHYGSDYARKNHNPTFPATRRLRAGFRRPQSAGAGSRVR